MPLPACSNEPTPLNKLAKVKMSDRLTNRVPKFETAPVPSVPLVPPEPICRLPALIVVAPS